METKRLKVLVIAHEFSPIKGSECAVGWNIAIRLARYHDITVLYASGSHEGNNSYVKAVRSYIAANGSFKGISFINIDQPRLTKFIFSLTDILKI